MLFERKGTARNQFNHHHHRQLGIMRWKPKFLMLMVCLHVQGTSSAKSNIDLAAVKRFVVQRTTVYDHFTVVMKPNHTCTSAVGGVPSWCTSLEAHHLGSTNRTFCSCTCQKTRYSYSFVAFMQKCVNASQAEGFGGCKKYFNSQSLLQEAPVNLMAANQHYVTVTDQANGTTCELKGEYFDYSRFQTTWQNISNGLFHLRKTKSQITVGWKANPTVSRKLAGRIIRLVVTCENFKSCFLLRASGTVIHYATIPSSTSSTHTIVSSSNMDPFLSPTPSVVMRSSTSSYQSQFMSLSQPNPPTMFLSSSLSSSPSRSPPRPPSSSPSPAPSHHVSPSPSPSPPSPSPPHHALPSPSSPPPSPSHHASPSPSSPSPSPSSSPSHHASPSSSPSSSSSSSSSSSQSSLSHTSTAKAVQPTEPSKTSSTLLASSTAGSIGPGGHETQTGGNNSGVAIGAAVGGALVIGAIVIIVILVFRKRRKAGKSHEKQGQHVKNPVYGTSSNEIPLERSKGSQSVLSNAQDNQQQYQGLIISNGKSNDAAIYSSPEDDYDNCNVYQSLEKEKPGSPVYQSLNASQGKVAHTTALPKNSPRTSITDAPNSKAKLATGTPKSKPDATGNPYQKPIVPSEPVYNVLEGQDGEEDYEALNGDSLYNILEGPDATYESSDMVLENSTAESDPVCNVVEEAEDHQNPPESAPSTAQESLYNVLEDSNAGKDPLSQQSSSDLQDEPVYNILEESDSGAGPSKPCPLSGHDNPTYEQTLEFDDSYAAVHRPGPQRESLYEPLREPSQDLYAPLG